MNLSHHQRKHLYTLSCLLVVAAFLLFPDVFQYRVGFSIAFLIATLLAVCGILVSQSHEGWSLPYRGWLNALKDLHPWLMFMLVSAANLASLNEKLYAAHPSIHSLYGGAFTVGGLMPMSDNAEYLSGVLSFLQYGVIKSASVYRPSSTYLSALLFKASGHSMIVYHHLNTFLMIGAVWLSGMVLARRFGLALASVSVFLMCDYNALYHATFLTEVPGVIIGVLSFALLAEGFVGRRRFIFLMGLMLFVLAMHIRSGAVFIIPILVLAGILRFGTSRKGMALFLVQASLVCAIFGMVPWFQKMTLSKTFETASNAGFFLYQIQTDGKSWTKGYKAVSSAKWDAWMRQSKTSNAGENVFIARTVMSVALEKIRKDPSTFAVNYAKFMFRIMKRPQLTVFPFMRTLSRHLGLTAIALFLITPLLYRREGDIYMLFILLLLFMAGSILSSPFLFELRKRLYAVSMSSNILVFSMAFANALLLLRAAGDIFLRRIRPCRIDGLNGQSGRGFGVLESMPAGTSGLDGTWQRICVAVSILVSLLVVAAPIIVDRTRNYIPPVMPLSGFKPAASDTVSESFLLSVKDSPHALFETDADFNVEDPLRIPGIKLRNNNPLDKSLDGRFYMFNALNHDRYSERYDFSDYLVLPVSKLKGVPIERISTLILRGHRVVKMGGHLVLFKVEEVEAMGLIEE